MHTQLAPEIRPEILVGLAESVFIPTRELAMVCAGAPATPAEAARGICALAATGGRLSAQNGANFLQVTALFEKVTALIEGCSAEVFQTWFRNRGDSDFAMGRDFINYQRRFGSQDRTTVDRALERFQSAVSSRLGQPSFDVYADAYSEGSRPPPSLELVDLKSPRHWPL